MHLDTAVRHKPFRAGGEPATAPTIEPPATEPAPAPGPQRTEPERTTTPFSPPEPNTEPARVPDGDPCRQYPFCRV